MQGDKARCLPRCCGAGRGGATRRALSRIRHAAVSAYLLTAEKYLPPDQDQAMKMNAIIGSFPNYDARIEPPGDRIVKPRAQKRHHDTNRSPPCETHRQSHDAWRRQIAPHVAVVQTSRVAVRRNGKTYALNINRESKSKASSTASRKVRHGPRTVQVIYVHDHYLPFSAYLRFTIHRFVGLAFQTRRFAADVWHRRRPESVSNSSEPRPTVRTDIEGR